MPQTFAAQEFAPDEAMTKKTAQKPTVGFLLFGQCARITV
jgi:hypothetical protein